MALNITPGAIAARLPADLREQILNHPECELLIEDGTIIGARGRGLDDRGHDPTLERLIELWGDVPQATRMALWRGAEAARAWHLATTESE